MALSSACGRSTSSEKDVMESVMSDVLGIPVTTLSTAGEGGAWGVASLASKIMH